MTIVRDIALVIKQLEDISDKGTLENITVNIDKKECSYVGLYAAAQYIAKVEPNLSIAVNKDTKNNKYTVVINGTITNTTSSTQESAA